MGKINLEKGKAVAFDFDGVIHKYSDGWQNGEIYDEANEDVIEFIRKLMAKGIPCIIISTRPAQQIKAWWDKQGFSILSMVISSGMMYFKDVHIVGITNRKLPAQLYIDDRAYRYEGQSCKALIDDFVIVKGG